MKALRRRMRAASMNLGGQPLWLLCSCLFIFLERAESWSVLAFDEVFNSLVLPRTALEKGELIAFRRAVAQGRFEVRNQKAVAVGVFTGAQRKRVFFRELRSELVYFLHHRRSRNRIGDKADFRS